MAVTIFQKYSYLPSPKDMRKDPEMTCGAATLSYVATGLSINNNKFLKLIGEITIEWSKVERSIDEIIWDCLGVDRKHGACVTAQYIGAGPRCRALSSLCYELGLTKEVCDDINLFKVSAHTAGEKRNRLVHDYWSETVARDGTTITWRHEIKTEKKLSFKHIETTINDLEEFLESVQRLYDIFNYGIRPSIFQQLSALHHTPSEE